MAGDCRQAADQSAAEPAEGEASPVTACRLSGGGSPGCFVVSFPGCSSWARPPPTVSEPGGSDQIRWKSSRHAQLRAMMFLGLRQRHLGLHLVANVQVSAHGELSLKNRGSGQTSSTRGCSYRLPQLPCHRLLLAVTAGLSPLHTLPSCPAPKRGFLARLRGGSSRAGAAWGEAGDGAGLGTPLPALPCSGSSPAMLAGLQEL